MENDVKQRAGRNRTLTLTESEQAMMAARLLRPDSGGHLAVEDIRNTTICADLLEVLPQLPSTFADLIIIDPPYNLSKDFNGMKFKASSDEGYLEYLRSWFPQVCRLLKPNGSLYLCGD